MRVYAMAMAVLGIVGAVLVMALTVQAGEPLVFAAVLAVLWSLAVSTRGAWPVFGVGDARWEDVKRRRFITSHS